MPKSEVSLCHPCHCDLHLGVLCKSIDLTKLELVKRYENARGKKRLRKNGLLGEVDLCTMVTSKRVGLS